MILNLFENNPLAHSLTLVSSRGLQSREFPSIIIFNLAKIPILTIQNRSRGGNVIFKFLLKSFCTRKEVIPVPFGTTK